MPYRPEELTSQQSVDVGVEFFDLSERIDREMLRSYRGGAFRFLTEPCPDAVLAAIRAFYRGYGWYVSWENHPFTPLGRTLLFMPISRSLPSRVPVEAAAR